MTTSGAELGAMLTRGLVAQTWGLCQSVVVNPDRSITVVGEPVGKGYATVPVAVADWGAPFQWDADSYAIANNRVITWPNPTSAWGPMSYLVARSSVGGAVLWVRQIAPQSPVPGLPASVDVGAVKEILSDG